MFNLFKSAEVASVASKVFSTIEMIEQIEGVEVEVSPRPGSRVITLKIELQNLENTQEKILDLLEKTGNFPVLTGGAIFSKNHWGKTQDYCINYAVITK